MSACGLARGERTGFEPITRSALQRRERTFPLATGASRRRRACSARCSLAESRDAEAEPLMIAADRALKPVPGRQARERDANRARLAALYTRQGRPQQAAAYR